MKVRATDKYKKLNLKDNELNRIPEIGEVFEVTKERYELLTEKNKYNEVFVEKIEEEKIETAIKEEKVETAVKKVNKNKENR